jgi:hypothetical protein
VTQEFPELHTNRAVQSEFVMQPGDGGIGRPVTQHGERGITRQQLHQAKHQQGYQHHGQRDLTEASPQYHK